MQHKLRGNNGAREEHLNMKPIRQGILRCSLAAALIACGIATISQAVAQDLTMRIYSNAAPGSEHWQRPEEASEGGVRNVRDPMLLAYLPDRKIATGTAAIILPGGGLRGLSIGTETGDLIKLLNQNGIAAFVLKYRTLQTAAPAGPPPQAFMGKFPKLEIRNGNANPSPGDAALSQVLRFATADAQVALKMVRAGADKWQLDPKRIGMIGFSAGGGVAMGTIMANAPGTTPDFFASIYGPSLQDVTVQDNAPPIYLVTETPHGPVTDGLIALFGLWREAGRPAELHVYDVPNFTMPISLYGERIIAWLKEQKMLTVTPKTDDAL